MNSKMLDLWKKEIPEDMWVLVAQFSTSGNSILMYSVERLADASTDCFTLMLYVHYSSVEDGSVHFGTVLIDLDCVSTAGCVGCTVMAVSAI